MPNHFEFMRDLYKGEREGKAIQRFILGDNLLHIAASLATLDELEATIKWLGNEANLLSKLYNSDNRLPLDIAANSNGPQKNEICRLIDEIMIDKSFTPLKPSRTFEQIRADNTHFIEKNPLLLKLLQYGYMAYSLSQNMIKCCLISSESNELDLEAYKKKCNDFFAMRDEYNDEIENEEEESEQEKYQIDLEELEPINDEMFEEKVGQLSKDERTYNHLNIIIKHIFQRQIGSCFEYACVNLYHLLYLNIEELSTHNLSIELFRIQNNYSSFASCNHVVSVIGRRLNSNPSDYKTWGNAVIVDAHDVYVKDLMPQKLRLFFDIPNQKNAGIVSIPFNPNAHETVLVPDMNFSTKYVQNFTSDLLKIRALKKNSFFSNHTTESLNEEPKNYRLRNNYPA